MVDINSPSPAIKKSIYLLEYDSCRPCPACLGFVHLTDMTTSLQRQPTTVHRSQYVHIYHEHSYKIIYYRETMTNHLLSFIKKMCDNYDSKFVVAVVTKISIFHTVQTFVYKMRMQRENENGIK